jgi:cell fate (sporulation/competence/biofilm development) regulator YmcA (YheA/YmcA/DUF963 family)
MDKVRKYGKKEIEAKAREIKKIIPEIDESDIYNFLKARQVEGDDSFEREIVKRNIEEVAEECRKNSEIINSSEFEEAAAQTISDKDVKKVMQKLRARGFKNI